MDVGFMVGRGTGCWVFGCGVRSVPAFPGSPLGPGPTLDCWVTMGSWTFSAPPAGGGTGLGVGGTVGPTGARVSGAGARESSDVPIPSSPDAATMGVGAAAPPTNSRGGLGATDGGIDENP